MIFVERFIAEEKKGGRLDGLAAVAGVYECAGIGVGS